MRQYSKTFFVNAETKLDRLPLHYFQLSLIFTSMVSSLLEEKSPLNVHLHVSPILHQAYRFTKEKIISFF
jgi:hypothetical protein